MKAWTMSWLLWALLSALFAGATAVLAKVGVAGINSNLATAIRTVVVVIFTILLAARTSSLAEVGKLTAWNWAFLALSGLATGLSWLCYFRALQLGPASRVAPIDKLSVVFVALLGVSLLGEHLTVLQWFGVGLITLGAVCMAV